MIRRPFSGCWLAYSSRTDIRPGISCSASMISLRPHSARDRSGTLNSNAFECFTVVFGSVNIAVIFGLLKVIPRRRMLLSQFRGSMHRRRIDNNFKTPGGQRRLRAGLGKPDD